MNWFVRPRFRHDCDKCVWIGQYENFDCWYCPPVKTNPFGGDIILRTSSEPSEYHSYCLSIAYRIATSSNSDVQETESFPAMLAVIRAITERGLVSMRFKPSKKKIAEYRHDQLRLQKP